MTSHDATLEHAPNLMTLMTRDQVDEQLVDYLYDELDDVARAAFEASLPAYPELADAVVAHQETRTLAAKLPEWTLSPAALERIERTALGAMPSVAEVNEPVVPVATVNKDDRGSLFERMAQFFMRPAFAGALAMALIGTVGVVFWQQRAHEGNTDSQRVAPRISAAAPEAVKPAGLREDERASSSAPAATRPTSSKLSNSSLDGASNVGGLGTATPSEQVKAAGAKLELPTLKRDAGESPRGGVVTTTVPAIAPSGVVVAPPAVEPVVAPAVPKPSVIVTTPAKAVAKPRRKKTRRRRNKQRKPKKTSVLTTDDALPTAKGAARGDGASMGAEDGSSTAPPSVIGNTSAGSTGSAAVPSYGSSGTVQFDAVQAESTGSGRASLAELWESYDRHVRSGRLNAAQRVLSEIEDRGENSRTAAARDKLAELKAAAAAGGPPRKVPAAKRRSKATSSD